MSSKVQVIFYRMYGHVHKMAQAVVEGAKQEPGKRSCPRTRWLS
jgi:multimeric flavodoxin WrbA